LQGYLDEGKYPWPGWGLGSPDWQAAVQAPWGQPITAGDMFAPSA
jgi:hypothetical protein